MGNVSVLPADIKEHITLELFYGAHLEDAQERIVGVGKNTRHMKLKSLQEIDPITWLIYYNKARKSYASALGTLGYLHLTQYILLDA